MCAAVIFTKDFLLPYIHHYRHRYHRDPHHRHCHRHLPKLDAQCAKCAELEEDVDVNTMHTELRNQIVQSCTCTPSTRDIAVI